MGSAATAGRNTLDRRKEKLAWRVIYWKQQFLTATTNRGKSNSLWMLASMEDRLGN
jgi:hypothetical protein